MLDDQCKIALVGRSFMFLPTHAALSYKKF